MKGERALSREAWCAWKSVRAGLAARAKALRQEELGPATEVKEGRRGPACEGGAAEQRREQGRAGPRGSPSVARRMRPRRQQQDVAGGSPEEGHRGGGGGRGWQGSLAFRASPLPTAACSRGARVQCTPNPPLPVCVPSAGYLPNSVHAVEAMLAAASIGAIWSSMSPDFGVNVSPGPHQRGCFWAP